MFKIRRLKFGRSTIFYYLCTGFENEADGYSSSRTDVVCIPWKRYDDDGRLLHAGNKGQHYNRRMQVSRSKQAPWFSGRNWFGDCSPADFRGCKNTKFLRGGKIWYAHS